VLERKTEGENDPKEDEGEKKILKSKKKREGHMAGELVTAVRTSTKKEGERIDRRSGLVGPTVFEKGHGRTTAEKRSLEVRGDHVRAALP